MIRLYAALGVAVVLLAGIAWGGVALYRTGYNKAVVEQKTKEELLHAATLAFESSAALAISKIQVKHVTVRQNLEKEITHDVRYRECVASPRVLELTNQSITGRSDAPSDSVLPAAQPTQ